MFSENLDYDKLSKFGKAYLTLLKNRIDGLLNNIDLTYEEKEIILTLLSEYINGEGR